MNMHAQIDFLKVPKANKLTDEQIEEIGRRLLHASSVRQIAREMGVCLNTVQRRARPIIAAMREAGTLGQCMCGQPRFHPRICAKNLGRVGHDAAPEQIERRARILEQIVRGDTFAVIGARFGLAPKTAKHYLRWLTPKQRNERKALEQARHYRGAFRSALQAHRDPTYALIAAAVPHGASEATREDAISDLYLAVLEGKVATADIPVAAKRYASRAVGKWESRFGPRSLDEKIFDDGRETWADALADPETLDPLEWRLSV